MYAHVVSPFIQIHWFWYGVKSNPVWAHIVSQVSDVEFSQANNLQHSEIGGGGKHWSQSSYTSIVSVESTKIKFEGGIGPVYKSIDQHIVSSISTYTFFWYEI